jgi:hypothetical protein
MEIKARTKLTTKYDVRSYLMSACTKRIYIVEKLDKITCMYHTAVRSEIPGPVTNHPAGKINPRKFFRTHTYPRIGLGILEKDVVARFELLYKIIFQKKSICFGIDYSIFRISDLRDHDSRLTGQPLCRHKILSHPFMQVFCLTYIYDIPLSVIISIDARGMWKQ